MNMKGAMVIKMDTNEQTVTNQSAFQIFPD